MTLWMKAGTVTAVGLLIFFGSTVNGIHSTVYVPEPAYLAPMQVPMPLIRREVTLDNLLEGLPKDQHAFRPRFFEQMNFRGVQLDRTGTWLAIFADDRDRLLRLRAGETHDGVKVESAHARGCFVRYGSIERAFELP